MTPWTADRMGSEEGRGRRQWKEKGRTAGGCSLAAGSVSPRPDGGREGPRTSSSRGWLPCGHSWSQHQRFRSKHEALCPGTGGGPGDLHTDVFWLLSLLGISFTPRDFSSICFFTKEDRQGKTVGGVVCDPDRVPGEGGVPTLFDSCDITLSSTTC